MQQRVAALQSAFAKLPHSLHQKWSCPGHFDCCMISVSVCVCLSHMYIQLFLCMYNQAAIQKLMVFAALIYLQNFKLMYCLQSSDIFSLVWCFYIEVTWSCWSSSGLCTWVNEQVLVFFFPSSPSSISPCSKSCGQEDSHTHLSLTHQTSLSHGIQHGALSQSSACRYRHTHNHQHNTRPYDNSEHCHNFALKLVQCGKG